LLREQLKIKRNEEIDHELMMEEPAVHLIFVRFSFDKRLIEEEVRK